MIYIVLLKVLYYQRLSGELNFLLLCITILLFIIFILYNLDIDYTLLLFFFFISVIDYFNNLNTIQLDFGIIVFMRYLYVIKDDEFKNYSKLYFGFRNYSKKLITNCLWVKFFLYKLILTYFNYYCLQDYSDTLINIYTIYCLYMGIFMFMDKKNTLKPWIMYCTNTAIFIIAIGLFSFLFVYILKYTQNLWLVKITLLSEYLYEVIYKLNITIPHICVFPTEKLEGFVAPFPNYNPLEMCGCERPAFIYTKHVKGYVEWSNEFMNKLLTEDDYRISLREADNHLANRKLEIRPSAQHFPKKHPFSELETYNTRKEFSELYSAIKKKLITIEDFQNRRSSSYNIEGTCQQHGDDLKINKQILKLNHKTIQDYLHDNHENIMHPKMTAHIPINAVKSTRPTWTSRLG